MGKLAQYMNQNTTRMKRVLSRYIVTVLCAAVVSILYVIIESLHRYNQFLDDTVTVMLIFAAGCFFVESKNVWKKRSIGYAVSLMIALLFKFASYIITEKVTDTWGLKALFFGYLLILYIASMIGLAIYFLIRENQIDVATYIGRAGFALLRAVGVFLVLNIATILIMTIIDSLLFDIKIWEIEEYVQILLAGFVYFPICLMSLSDMSEDNSTFTKKFVSYILMPCVWVAMTIIYLYVVKIFVTGDIPSNEIFGICQWLFIYGAPVWLMSYSFLEGKETTYRKLVKMTKYIYAPFILLEIYAISVRIHAYGLTENRYAAVLFIIIQLIYIFWEQICILYDKLRKQEKPREFGKGYENMIIVYLVIMASALFLPRYNITSACYHSQRSRLIKNIESDKIAAGDAYRYLKYNPYGERYIDEEYDNERIAQLESKDYYENEYDLDWTYVSTYGKPLKTGLNLEPGYTKLYSMNYDLNSTKAEDLEYFANIELDYGDGKKIHTDLRDCLKYYAENEENPATTQSDFESSEKACYDILIDDNHKLIIYDIRFSYTYDMKEIRNLSINGYLFEK